MEPIKSTQYRLLNSVGLLKAKKNKVETTLEAYKLRLKIINKNIESVLNEIEHLNKINIIESQHEKLNKLVKMYFSEKNERAEMIEKINIFYDDVYNNISNFEKKEKDDILNNNHDNNDHDNNNNNHNNYLDSNCEKSGLSSIEESYLININGVDVITFY